MFIKISENTCVTSEKTVIIKANNFYDKYSLYSNFTDTLYIFRISVANGWVAGEPKATTKPTARVLVLATTKLDVC